MKRLTLILSFGILASQALYAQPDLRDALKDSVSSHWVYDDFPLARARAQETGKPLLILFRCAP